MGGFGMKKKLLGIVFAFILALSILPVGSAQASVMWGKTELKKGQIGKATLLNDSQLWIFSKDQKSLVESRKLKKGEEYRVYTFKSDFGGLYGVGGGAFIKKSPAVKYETPSKTKLQALGVNFSEHIFEGEFTYPQVEGLISSEAQKKINTAIKKHMAASYQSLLKLEEDEFTHREDYYNEHGYDVPADEEPMFSYEYDVSYEVKYNENNLLSILIYDYMYTGGAHGMSTVEAYNFDVLTGSQISLTSLAKSSTSLTKIKNYAKTDLLNQNKKWGMIFTDTLPSIAIDNNRPYYFYDNGIVVKFFEYEVAAYAAGMPEVKVPYSVFK